MKNFSFLILLLVGATSLQAQDKPKEYVYQTFKDTRVINTYSIETLQKRKMDIRIAHRFGDVFNQWSFKNAWSSFFGLESAADVEIGVEYGITDNLMVGLHRTKGNGPLKSNLIGLFKYKFLSQTKGSSMPLSMAVAGSASLSTMWEVGTASSLTAFNPGANAYKRFSSRLSYSVQLHAARKFGDVLSLQLSPTFVWRNLVAANDNNYLMSMGVVARIQISKIVGVIIDSNIPFDALRWKAGSGFYVPLGIGLEFDTGGHVFQFNITNAAGIEPTDYIPYTSLDWAKGQFRIGFTISRAFRI